LSEWKKAASEFKQIVAAILAARKLANLDPRPSPALNVTIADAVEKAERIIQKD
jgi:hypothetical protein